MATTTGKIIHGVTIKPREIIRPKVEVKVTTPSQKKEVLSSSKLVISTHRKVLEALRDR